MPTYILTDANDKKIGKAFQANEIINAIAFAVKRFEDAGVKIHSASVVWNFSPKFSGSTNEIVAEIRGAEVFTEQDPDTLPFWYVVLFDEEEEDKLYESFKKLTIN